MGRFERCRVVLLDAGGTLIEIDPQLLRSALPAPFQALASDERLAQGEAVARRWADVAVRRQQHGRELWNGYFSRLLEQVGVPRESLSAACERLWLAHHERGLWRKPIDGALLAVSRLAAKGYRLAVVSNAEGQVQGDLEAAGFGRYLETVVDSHLVGISKPDPGIFRIALERLGATAEESIHVGDVPAFDVVGAVAAGIEPVLIDPYDIHRDEVRAMRFARLADLVELL